MACPYGWIMTELILDTAFNFVGRDCRTPWWKEVHLWFWTLHFAPRLDLTSFDRSSAARCINILVHLLYTKAQKVHNSTVYNAYGESCCDVAVAGSQGVATMVIP